MLVSPTPQSTQLSAFQKTAGDYEFKDILIGPRTSPLCVCVCVQTCLCCSRNNWDHNMGSWRGWRAVRTFYYLSWKDAFSCVFQEHKSHISMCTIHTPHTHTVSHSHSLSHTHTYSHTHMHSHYYGHLRDTRTGFQWQSGNLYMQ